MTLSHGASIVTDNLILMLDAANPRSYPGSGTAWNDLSGNNLNTALVGTPTYNSNYNGYLTFNGTSQYVSLPYSSTNLSFSGKNFSQDCWIYLTAYSQLFTSFYAAALFSNYWLQWSVNGTATSWNGIIFYVPSGTVNTVVSYAFSLNTWYNLSFTYTTSTGTWTIYVNGKSIGSIVGATTWTEGNTNPYYIGNNPRNGENYYFPGRIANFKIYNNATLSAAQVAQNFEAYRGRYGV